MDVADRIVELAQGDYKPFLIVLAASVYRIHDVSLAFVEGFDHSRVARSRAITPLSIVFRLLSWSGAVAKDDEKKFVGFKEFLAMEAQKPPVVLWYETIDEQARTIAEAVIEEGKSYQIDSRYSARHDVAKQPNQKDHTHVYLKGNEVCVVNKDGTPSHGSAPFNTLPADIQKKIKSLKLVEARSLLAETASGTPQVLLSRALTLRLWMILLVESAKTDGAS